MDKNLSLKIKSLAAQECDSCLLFLEQIVNTNSYTTNIAGANRVQDYVAEALSELGLSIDRISRTECGDILRATTTSKATDRILLVGHIDTVHPPDSKFSKFTREGDIARGPGILDMKGGIAVMIWALRALWRAEILNNIPLTVLINTDEETASIHSRDIIFNEAKKAQAALVFEWGRQNDNLITRRKGVGIFTLKVQGKTAHSGSSFSEGASAVLQLAHTVSRIGALTNLSEGLTVNVGLVKGGSAVNTVADQAEATFDVRVIKQSTFERVRQELQSIEKDIVIPGTSVSITEGRFVPPMEQSDATRALFEDFHSFAAESGLSYEIHPDIIGGGSDANTTFSAGTPSLDGLGPFGEFAHSDKEYIKVSSLQPKITNVAMWLASKAI